MKILFLSLGCLILLCLSSCVKCKCKSVQFHEEHAGDTSALQMQFHPVAWEKIGIRLQQAWEQNMRAKQREKSLHILLKTQEKPNKEQKTALKSTNFNARAFAGNIITGTIKVKDLEGLAKLTFVRYLELSAPLSPK